MPTTERTNKNVDIERHLEKIPETFTSNISGVINFEMVMGFVNTLRISFKLKNTTMLRRELTINK